MTTLARSRFASSGLIALTLGFHVACGDGGDPQLEDLDQLSFAATVACKADTLRSYSNPAGAWTATASSLEATYFSPISAFDGTQRSRWSSAFADHQWVAVDLKSRQYIDNIEVQWEAASARHYDLQVSDDGSTWRTVATVTNNTLGTHSRRFNGLETRARYVRLYGYTRTTPYGFSAFDVVLAGDTNASCDSTLPICGNGIVESGEQCDDNNTIDDNTCSASCRLPSYRFQAQHSGKVLDVADWSAQNGGKIQQWGYGGGNNQKWTYTITPDGWQIRNVYSGKCLDVAGPSTADGAKVHQWDCHSGRSQLWQPVYQLDAVTFVNAYSGKCLDVSDVSTQDGAALQQWSCNGSVAGPNNQKWDILSN